MSIYKGHGVRKGRRKDTDEKKENKRKQRPAGVPMEPHKKRSGQQGGESEQRKERAPVRIGKAIIHERQERQKRLEQKIQAIRKKRKAVQEKLKQQEKKLKQQEERPKQQKEQREQQKEQRVARKAAGRKGTVLTRDTTINPADIRRRTLLGG